MNIHLERWFSNPSLLPLNPSSPFPVVSISSKNLQNPSSWNQPISVLSPPFSSFPFLSLIKVPPKLGTRYVEGWIRISFELSWQCEPTTQTKCVGCSLIVKKIHIIKLDSNFNRCMQGSTYKRWIKTHSPRLTQYSSMQTRFSSPLVFMQPLACVVEHFYRTLGDCVDKYCS